MGIRAMKFDLFVLKTLEKKGYTVEELVKLEDKELDELNLPEKIISQIKEYKLRGGKTPLQVAEELAALMEADGETNMEEDEVLSTYKGETSRTMVLEVPDIQTEDDAKAFIDKVKENLGDAVIENEDSSITIKTDGSIEIQADEINIVSDEVEIVRTIAKTEDLEVIKEVLQKKELRSFAAYTKLLKTEVPEAILGAVESTTLNTLIDERIAEVKAASTK